MLGKLEFDSRLLMEGGMATSSAAAHEEHTLAYYVI